MKVKCGNTEVNKHKYIVTQENKETVKKLLDFLSRPPSDVQQKAVRGEKKSSLTSNMDLSIDLLQLFALLHFFVMGGNTEKLKMQKQHNHYMYNDLKVQLERIYENCYSKLFCIRSYSVLASRYILGMSKSVKRLILFKSLQKLIHHSLITFKKPDISS